MTSTTQPRSKLGALGAITGGTGPMVLLIHGVGLQAEAWDAQFQFLATSFAVIAVDLPGHGKSAQFRGNPKLADYTDAIAACLTSPAIVIGHSFGAMIALDLAVRFPELVRGVVAMNGIFKRDTAAKAAVLARAASLDGVSKADPSATLMRWFGDKPSAEREACGDWLAGVDPAGYRDAYRLFASADGPSKAALMRLGCPALFLTGGDEPNSTPAMSQRMAELTPRGRAVVIMGAAHMLPMTHASQVNDVLQKFIEGVQHDAT